MSHAWISLCSQRAPLPDLPFLSDKSLLLLSSQDLVSYILLVTISVVQQHLSCRECFSVWKQACANKEVTPLGFFNLKRVAAKLLRPPPAAPPRGPWSVPRCGGASERPRCQHLSAPTARGGPFGSTPPLQSWWMVCVVSHWGYGCPGRCSTYSTFLKHSGLFPECASPLGNAAVGGFHSLLRYRGVG